MAQINVDPLARASKMPAELVNDFISRVQGHSSLAKLSAQQPLAFNGNEYMVFDMPNEIDVVAESGPKAHGGVTAEPVTVMPIKFEYGARVSDEFMYASDEKQLDILRAFNEGFAKKVARGLDIAAMHGLNPRTGEKSEVIGDKNFDSKVTQTVKYVAASADANLDEAIGKVKNENADVTGLAIAPAMGSALGAMTTEGGTHLYPDFQFGATPENLGGIAIDSNSTVAVGDMDYAIVGDFENAFKWGIAKEIGVEVIPYGDPDNSGKDLKGQNQVYLRSEVYLGWAILVPTAFARVTAE